nr:SMI1/KNR4 family protein [Paenibacillus xylanexedens]
MSLVKNTIDGLKRRLELSNEYIHIQDREGNVERYNCKFAEPANNEEIERLVASTGLKIPLDYLDFLKMCNGCSLFNHEIYGGESSLFPLDQVEYLYTSVNRVKGYLEIAYISDDTILIDCKAYSRGEKNYVLVGNSSSSFEDYKSLECNFETWLYRFIITNGSKYWVW